MESAKGGENGESIRGGAAGVGGAGGAGPRREVWVRPGGHRTTLRTAADDTLDTMTPVEVTFNIFFMLRINYMMLLSFNFFS